MSESRNGIAPPRDRNERSSFSRIVSPVNVTILALLVLLLPEIEHQISDLLFFLLRPLTVALAVTAIGAVVSLVSILGGLLVGLRPGFVAFGPVQIRLGGEIGWGVGINQSWRHFVGSVLMVPVQGRFGRNQLIIYASIGLVTSLALLIWLFTEARSLGWPTVDEPGMSTQVAALWISAPLGAFIVGLAEVLTGGTILSSLLRGGADQANRMLATMTIASRMALGERPAKWDRELLEEAISVPDTTADHLMGLCFAYLSAVDHGDLSSANRHLQAFERWLHESNPNVRPYVLSSLAGYASLYHERAWLTAAHRKDLDGASEYLNRAAGFDVAMPIDLRVKAELLSLEGDREAAETLARAGLNDLDSFPVMERWRVPFERDLLNRVLDQNRA